MTFLRLIRSELTRLTSNITPIVTILGLAMVPVLYAGVYLSANWDPYSNLDEVDAALVNLDAGADFDGEFRVIGDDVEEELIDEGSFGWQEVSSHETADQGVAEGDYQFALTIPEGFSEALASPSSFESAEQATLDITTNETNNYLLSSIVEVLAFEVHASVSAEVGEETADALLTGFGRIHQELVEAADGAGEIQEGSEELHEGLVELQSGAGDLSAGASDAEEGAGALLEGLGQLQAGTGEVEEGAEELSAGATTLSSGLSELSTGADDLQDAADELSSGAGELDSGVSELSEGAEQVALGNEQLSAASDDAAEIIAEFESSAQNRADDGVQALIDAEVITEEDADAAGSALESSAEDSDLLDRAQTARTELSEAQESIDELAAGSRELADGVSELSDGSSTLSTGTSELAGSVPDLTEGIDNAHSGAQELSSGGAELADGAEELDRGAGELVSGGGELSEGLAELSEGADDLHGGLGEAEEGGEELTEGSEELAAGLDSGTDDVPNPDEQQRDELSSVMGDPVEVNETSQAEADTYGSGMAPFFLALSLWIGALVMLQVLRPLSPRALASNAPVWALALGSWVPFLMLAAVQGLALFGVAHFGLGLGPAHPWLTLGVLLLASTAFSALIHGVVSLLGNPGKMLIIALLVLQLVASGGMFPPEALPAPFSVLHPVLPMSYVVDGLRHVSYGADLTVLYGVAGALITTTLIGLGLTVAAVRRHRMWDLDRLQPSIEEAA